MKRGRRLLYSLLLVGLLMAALPFRATAADNAHVIQITAKRFEFTPNVVTLKRGEPVTLRVTSADVTHGFYSKQLKIDEVLEPGKTVDVNLTPQTPGTYTLICDHFCGSGHGNMKMTIVVE